MMGLIKKLVVGTSLGILLGAGYVALSNRDIISRDNAQGVTIYLTALAGSYIGCRAAFSKPMDRVLDKAKRFLITENPYIRYR